MAAPQVPADVAVVLSPSLRPGGAPWRRRRELTPLRELTSFGELDFRWVVHQKVDVVLIAVELFQLGFEVLADPAHDLLAAGEHRVGEGTAPVLGDKNQVDVQIVDNMTFGADIGIGVPAW